MTQKGNDGNVGKTRRRKSKEKQQEKRSQGEEISEPVHDQILLFTKMNISFIEHIQNVILFKRQWSKSFEGCNARVLSSNDH